MARSHYIYAVQTSDGVLVRAFTVRHEVTSWLEVADGVYLVTRLHDGLWGHKPPVQLNPHTLEPAV